MLLPNKNIQKLIVIGLSGLLFCLLFDAIIIQSPFALRQIGAFSKILPFTIITIGIAISLVELLSKYFACINNYIISFYQLINRHHLAVVIQIFAVFLIILSFQVPIFAAWAGTQPLYSAGLKTAIGGVVPGSGGHELYHAAYFLASFADMTPAGARRPMHPSYYAVLLILADFYIYWMYLLSGVAIGLAMTCFLRVLLSIIGLGATIIVGGLLLSMAYWTMPTAMNAPAGLFYGLISSTLILIGFYKRDSKWLAIGACVMLIGFAARAGDYFVVPAVLLAGLIITITQKQCIKRYIAYSLIAIIVGWSIPMAFLAIYNGDARNYQGNFSHVLYMLASGSTNWRQAKIDFGNSKRKFSQAEWYDFVYKKAFEKLKKHPMVFVDTSMEIISTAIIKQPQKIARVLSSINQRKNTIIIPHFFNLKKLLLVLYMIGIVRVIFMRQAPNIKISCLIILISYYLCFPFTWLTGALRFHSVTWTLLAGICALPFMVRSNKPNQNVLIKSNDIYLNHGVFSIVLAVIMVIAGAILPRFVGPYIFDIKKPNHFTTLAKEPGSNIVFMVLGRQVPYLHVVANNNYQPIRPDIREKTINNNKYIKKYRMAFGTFSVGSQLSTVMYMIGKRKTFSYLVSDAFCMPNKPQLFEARLRLRDKGSHNVRYLQQLVPLGASPPKWTKSGLPDYCR